MQKLGGRLNIAATHEAEPDRREADRGAEGDDHGGSCGDGQRGRGGRDDEREEQQRADDLHRHRDGEREEHHEQRCRAARTGTPLASATCGSTDANSSGRAIDDEHDGEPTVKTANVRI